MCYSISQAKRKAYLSALKDGVPADEVERLYNEWQQSQKEDSQQDSESPMAFLNGFQHPKLFSLQHNSDHLKATRLSWGLIPDWVKDWDQAKSMRTKTLNARGESIFEKPSFKGSALEKRCLIFVNGFYEYHHRKGKTFPHFIQHQEKNRPLVFGGLSAEWVDQSSGEVHQTASIVTTRANELMTEIHNNPKLNEARMPLIIEPQDFQQWLHASERKAVEELIQPYDSDKLKAHTVGKLIGKNGIGDHEDATKEVIYQELNIQGELF